MKLPLVRPRDVPDGWHLRRCSFPLEPPLPLLLLLLLLSLPKVSVAIGVVEVVVAVLDALLLLLLLLLVVTAAPELQEDLRGLAAQHASIVKHKYSRRRSVKGMMH